MKNEDVLEAATSDLERSAEQWVETLDKVEALLQSAVSMLAETRDAQEGMLFAAGRVCRCVKATDTKKSEQ